MLITLNGLLPTALFLLGAIAPTPSEPSKGVHQSEDALQNGPGGPGPGPMITVSCGSYQGAQSQGIGGFRDSEQLYDTAAQATAAAMSNPLSFTEVAQSQLFQNTIPGGYICDFCPEVSGCDQENLFSIISGPTFLKASPYAPRHQVACNHSLLGDSQERLRRVHYIASTKQKECGQFGHTLQHDCKCPSTGQWQFIHVIKAPVTVRSSKLRSHRQSRTHHIHSTKWA